jgi:hypothetical protein
MDALARPLSALLHTVSATQPLLLSLLLPDQALFPPLLFTIALWLLSLGMAPKMEVFVSVVNKRAVFMVSLSLGVLI